MLDWILKKLGGTSNEREVKKVRPIVERVNALEPEMLALPDEEFKLRTAQYRERIDRGESLDALMPEVFAMVREAGRRVLKMRHFDMQIIGGAVLHKGRIAEMRTGEGKTLVATLPVVLNALEGKGVHVVTVNDYLAKRDAEWMGMIYGFLGLTTGVIVHAQNDRSKKAAYRADITYGQNNEFGFDYLRDNMKFSIYEYCQRPLHYAVVDEVDSILIDEARTPLIISGMAEESTDKYRTVDMIIPSLRKDEHFTLDEKGHSAMLTEEGVELCQRKLGISNLYDPANIETLHVLQQALKAHTLYKRDVHYMVTEDGHVLIIDEHTGRVLPGRRWSDGLHQAVEAKEKVRVQEETRTLATITFQNLFRLYKKLAGMTGTAATEAEEFHKTYKLEVVTIPTNKTMIRTDYEDMVYKTEKEKFRALIEEVSDCVQRGQPVLLGTASVEKNEAISTLLTRRGIKHEVLNAKQHEREAFVVAQAGRRSAVTVATNMAGRGTDILLGGNPEMLAKGELLGQEDPDGTLLAAALERHKVSAEKEKAEVIAVGGLHILGSERHEARRIDNQLRGRAGRQGDPGTSRFYLSLEDDLMRIFAADRISRLMDRMGMEENVPIEHRWVTKAVENAQKKVEARNFDIRKNLLEYDDVMNQQRKSIYALRKNILEGRYTAEVAPVDAAPKKGAPAPREIVPLAAPVVEHIRGVLDSMVRHYGVAKEGVELTPPYRDDDAARPLPTMNQLAGFAHEKVEREVYEYFGVPAELEDLAGDAKTAFDRLAEDVPRALAEQRERFLDLCDQAIGDTIERFCPEKLPPDDWDVPGLEAGLQEAFNLSFSGLGKAGARDLMAERAFADVERFIQKKEQEIGPELLLRVFRILYLEEIDKQWIEHLQAMDNLRDGIGLRGYGQRDPKLEYKKEGFNMFSEMMQNIQTNVLSKVFRVQVQTQADAQRLVPQRRPRRTVEGRGAGPAPVVGAPAGAPPPPQQQGMSAHQRAMQKATQAAPQKIETVRRESPKVGRNDPCPCGSGKKYKKCHGMMAGGGEAA